MEVPTTSTGNPQENSVKKEVKVKAEEWSKLHKNFLETGFGADVVIKTKPKGSYVLAHENVLKGNNLLLKVQLEDQCPVEIAGFDNPMKVLWMEDYHSTEVTEFLSFLYCGETPAAVANGKLAMAVYKLAKDYDILDLMTLMATTVEDMPSDNFSKKDVDLLFDMASLKMEMGMESDKLEAKAIEIFHRPEEPTNENLTKLFTKACAIYTGNPGGYENQETSQSSEVKYVPSKVDTGDADGECWDDLLDDENSDIAYDDCGPTKNVDPDNIQEEDVDKLAAALGECEL